MKQTTFAVVAALLLHQSILAQSKEVTSLIDSCIAILKANALNRDSVNWNIVEKEIHKEITGVTKLDELQNPISHLFEAVNDHHGGLQYKDKFFSWKMVYPPADDSIKKEFKKGVSIKTELLKNNTGYLLIPSINKEQRDAAVRQLNDSLCYLLKNGIKGLIIDLRLNTGGDVHPMTLGLQQLLGEVKLGTLVQKEGRSESFLKDNAYYNDTAIILKFLPACNIDASTLPVVFLTGFATASSAEFLILSFKGRRNTISLGTPTMGMVTSVGGIWINDDALLYFAGGYFEDREGKTYKTALQPDIYLDAVNKYNDVPNDPKVMAAMAWLTSHAR